jgi:sugar-specific transcriptional regulator TrmB
MSKIAKPSSLTSQEKTYIRRLGLSKHAISLYVLLLKHGELTAKQASNLSGEFAAAEYRLFGQLEEFGLARRQSGRPVKFTALPKDIGLRAAYMRSRSSLDQLVAKLGLAEGGQQGLEIIVGRQAQYKKYAELAAQARREICIYAIGIAYSEELLRTQRAALERGVRIRHVLQQVKPSNFHVAHRWQQLGVGLRYEPAEHGFHLMLFDDRMAMITFSDPSDTDDRLSILTENGTALRLFQAYFQDIWQQAREVNL